MKRILLGLALSCVSGGMILVAAVLANLFHAGMLAGFGDNPLSAILLAASDFVLSNALVVFVAVAVAAFAWFIVTEIRDPGRPL